MKFQLVSLVFLELSLFTFRRALGTFPLLSVIILRMTYPTMKPFSRLQAVEAGTATLRC